MTVQQFKPLDYQRVAAEAVVDCFAGQPRVEGLSYQIDPGRERSAQMALIGETGFRNAAVQLSEAQLLENVRQVQMREHLPPSDKLVPTRAAPINLDVEMETGTGKTYVYIDTMYRLYERYGWSKFIVVVPSVAIREGVFKTFEDTEAHFQERYGHKVRRFIYDSGRPEPILAFSDSPGLHCMIINTQAFASEVNAEGKESKTLRMFREMDAFQSRRPIDLIAGNHPILILDEPQRLEGAKTQEALSRFRAPIALRFSATHKTRHNLVHRLDALDAYTRKLVKRINVRGVTVKGLTGVHGYLYMSDIRVSADKPPEARVDIETILNAGKVKRTARWVKKGDDLHNMSGGLAAYEGHTVADIDAVTRTPPLESTHLGKRQPGGRHIAARSAYSSHHGQRVHDPVIAGFGNGVTQPSFGEFARHEAAAVGAGNGIQQANVGKTRPSEADDLCPRAQGGQLELFVMLGVGRDDGGAAWLQTGKDLGLGCSDRLHAAEIFDMCRGYRGDNRYMRANLGSQPFDLASMVHAHFENAEPAARRHTGQAQRHTDVVVVAAGGTMGCTAARAFETGEDGFLYAGLADRSGHADNLRFHTAARCTGKRLQRFSRVIDQDVGPVDRAIDDRTRSAVGEGFFEEAMAIHRFAPERDEQIAIDHVPAVHFDPGNLKVMAGRTTYSVGNILCRPQRQR